MIVCRGVVVRALEDDLLHADAAGELDGTVLLGDGPSTSPQPAPRSGLVGGEEVSELLAAHGPAAV